MALVVAQTSLPRIFDGLICNDVRTRGHNLQPRHNGIQMHQQKGSGRTCRDSGNDIDGYRHIFDVSDAPFY
jgi:hypothetical protein